MYQYGHSCAPSRFAWHEWAQKYDTLMIQVQNEIYNIKQTRISGMN